ncbi:hypothetical protein MMC28_003150 [Mycoblastus sanguinarius]|nr:hypothetical protein [Mycoblastus sanguinarius]
MTSLSNPDSINWAVSGDLVHYETRTSNPSDVSTMANINGKPRQAWKMYEQWEDEILVAMKNDNKPWKEIMVQIPERPLKGLKSRWSRKFKPSPLPTKGWTDAQTKSLLSLRADGYSYEQISVRIPGRSKMQCQDKFYRCTKKRKMEKRRASSRGLRAPPPLPSFNAPLTPPVLSAPTLAPTPLPPTGGYLHAAPWSGSQAYGYNLQGQMAPHHGPAFDDGGEDEEEDMDEGEERDEAGEEGEGMNGKERVRVEEKMKGSFGQKKSTTGYMPICPITSSLTIFDWTVIIQDTWRSRRRCDG